MKADVDSAPYPISAAENAAAVTPVNLNYAHGVVDRYATNTTPGTTDMSAGIQAAVNQRINGGSPVQFLPGATYRVDTSIAASGFTGLEIYGDGALIDFRTDSAFKFGNHTVNGSLEYTTVAPTTFNLIIQGLKFKPTVNGWDGNRFAHLNPIDLSAVENVVVRDCRFEDWDFAGVNIGAPSKHVLVERCYFAESQEGDVCYGVRPFAQIAGAGTDNYDETNGTLRYSAPTSYHQDIVVRDCYFYQCSHSILSWNVHGAGYVNNVFRKPTVRTVSATNWNFDVLIQGNEHLVEDNTTEVVSTAIAVGIGSERVSIMNEHFSGALSGAGVNKSMKLVDIAGVNKGIHVEGCIFDVTNCANLVLIGPNVGATIRGNHFRKRPAGTTATIVINDQTAAPVSSPGFNQPQIVIDHNVDELSTRFVNLANAPPGGSNANAIVIRDNICNTQLTDGMVVTHTAAAGWKVRARDNHFPGGAPTYVVDFGASATVFQDADAIVLRGSVTFAAATTASVALSITLASTNYLVTLGPAAHDKSFRLSDKKVTGFSIDASASSSDIVDWRIAL